MGASYEIYQDQILDHYKHPRNKGNLERATHQARESNPLCGDDITLLLQVEGSDRIKDIRFEGAGCAISQASASMLTERLKGKTLEEARSLGKEEILRMLGIPLSAVRMKCALLALQVLHEAIGGTAQGSGM